LARLVRAGTFLAFFPALADAFAQFTDPRGRAAPELRLTASDAMYRHRRNEDDWTERREKTFLLVAYFQITKWPLLLGALQLRVAATQRDPGHQRAA
jgi:hypothetical protein